MEKLFFLTHPLRNPGLEAVFPWTRYLPGRLADKMLKSLPLFGTIENASKGRGPDTTLLVSTVLPGSLAGWADSSVVRRIGQAGVKAKKRGAGLFGFGLYSSADREWVHALSKELNLPMVTGESFILAAAIEGLIFAARSGGIILSECVAAVVGADRPVGAVFAELLGREVKKIYLFGHNKAGLAKAANAIYYETGAVAIAQDNPETLGKADIVVVDPYFKETQGFVKYLKSKSIACDISVEQRLLRQIYVSRDDVTLIEGGFVQFPPDLNLRSLQNLVDLNPAFAGVLLAAMEIGPSPGVLPELNSGRVDRIAKLAKNSGFKINGFKEFCFP